MNVTATSKPSKMEATTKGIAKATFTDEDFSRAQQALRSIEVQPAYTRKQMQTKLEDELLAALRRGVSPVQLIETLSALGIVMSDSFITMLQRRARAGISEAAEAAA